MIIETLALAIGKTITVHFLTLYLNTVARTHIEIDGAPGWYYEVSEDEVASFAHAAGAMGSVETAKKSATDTMERDVQKTMEGLLYDFYKKTRSEKEEALILGLGKDENLRHFIQKSISYPNIVYNEEKQLAFVKASIPVETLLEYEKDRLQKIKIALVKSREQEAFETLKNESESYSQFETIE